MQPLDWNDLRYLLALHRGGSFAAASRMLLTDPTTVSRRLRSVEHALGVQLFARGAAGQMDATEAGEVAIARAEVIEAEVGGMTAAIMGADMSPSGTVRITAVPILVNHVLIPAAGVLLDLRPGLDLELVSDARDLNLSRREADIALRLARPSREVGSRIVAQRVGTLRYGVYAARHSVNASAGLPWLMYESATSHLPQARWTARMIEQGGKPSSLLVNDAEALLQAVCSGHGRALLPCMVAERMPGIIALSNDANPPSREIWLLTHPDLRRLARVDVTIEWLRTTLSRGA